MNLLETKKKITLLAAAITLSCVTAATAPSSASAASASAAAKPISVTLDSSKLQFNVDPINIGGTVYVEFKPLFQALGFGVSYDGQTKIVKGVSKDVTIQMQLNTTHTLVNGQAPKAPAKALAVAGHTLVPLRFIGEASGLEVAWDPKGPSVMLTHKGPSAEQVASIAAFFDEEAARLSAKDAAGYMAMIDPKSPAYEMTKRIMDYYLPNSAKIKASFSDLKIAGWDGSKATVTYTLVSKKDGDDFYIDRKSTGVSVLSLTEDGRWLVYADKLTGIDYLNADELTGHEAALPDEEKQAILSAIDGTFKAQNEEDLDASLAYLDPNSPLFDYAKQTLAQIFKTYDLKLTVEKATVVGFKDNVAYVYLVQTSEKLSGPALQNNRAYVIQRLTKNADGKWLLDPTGDIIKSEPLQ